MTLGLLALSLAFTPILMILSLAADTVLRELRGEPLYWTPHDQEAWDRANCKFLYIRDEPY